MDEDFRKNICLYNVPVAIFVKNRRTYYDEETLDYWIRVGHDAL